MLYFEGGGDLSEIVGDFFLGGGKLFFHAGLHLVDHFSGEVVGDGVAAFDLGTHGAADADGPEGFVVENEAIGFSGGDPALRRLGAGNDEWSSSGHS